MRAGQHRPGRLRVQLNRPDALHRLMCGEPHRARCPAVCGNVERARPAGREPSASQRRSPHRPLSPLPRHGHQLAGHRPEQQEDAALRTPRRPPPAGGAHRVRGPVPGRPPGADGVPPGLLRRKRLLGRALGRWSAYGAPPPPGRRATARVPAAPGPAPPCRGPRVPAVPVRSCGGRGAPGESGSPARGPTASVWSGRHGSLTHRVPENLQLTQKAESFSALMIVKS